MTRGHSLAAVMSSFGKSLLYFCRFLCGRKNYSFIGIIAAVLIFCLDSFNEGLS